MEVNMQEKRDRRRRRAIILAAGVGLVCGAYVLPRVAQAVTRKADPLSLKVAATALAPTLTVSVQRPVGPPPVAPPPWVVIPGPAAARTPNKPARPVPGYVRHHHPPAGLSFY